MGPFTPRALRSLRGVGTEGTGLHRKRQCRPGPGGAGLCPAACGGGGTEAEAELLVQRSPQDTLYSQAQEMNSDITLASDRRLNFHECLSTVKWGHHCIGPMGTRMMCVMHSKHSAWHVSKSSRNVGYQSGIKIDIWLPFLATTTRGRY